MKPRFPALLSLLLLGIATACGPTAPKTSVTEAAEKGYLNIVQKHIAAKSDLNATDAKGWTALHLAAMKDNLPMVQALCAAGADTQKAGPGGRTALDIARDRGQVAIAKLLMNQGQNQAQNRSGKGGGGRGLVDGGLGVSSVLDSQ